MNKNLPIVLAVISIIIGFLSLAGFGGIINIPKFYKSLSIEGKVLFWGIFNFIVTIFIFIILSNRISKVTVKSKK